MVEFDTSPKVIIDSVTMKSTWKLKNASLLRNLSDYKPALLIETRCSAKQRMLDRFVLLHEDLRKLNTSRDSDLEMDTSAQFPDAAGSLRYFCAKSINLRNRYELGVVFHRHVIRTLTFSSMLYRSISRDMDIHCTNERWARRLLVMMLIALQIQFSRAEQLSYNVLMMNSSTVLKLLLFLVC